MSRFGRSLRIVHQFFMILLQFSTLACHHTSSSSSFALFAQEVVLRKEWSEKHASNITNHACPECCDVCRNISGSNVSIIKWTSDVLKVVACKYISIAIFCCLDSRDVLVTKFWNGMLLPYGATVLKQWKYQFNGLCCLCLSQTEDGINSLHWSYASWLSWH